MQFPTYDDWYHSLSEEDIKDLFAEYVEKDESLKTEALNEAYEGVISDAHDRAYEDMKDERIAA